MPSWFLLSFGNPWLWFLLAGAAQSGSGGKSGSASGPFVLLVSNKPLWRLQVAICVTLKMGTEDRTGVRREFEELAAPRGGRGQCWPGRDPKLPHFCEETVEKKLCVCVQWGPAASSTCPSLPPPPCPLYIYPGGAFQEWKWCKIKPQRG